MFEEVVENEVTVEENEKTAHQFDLDDEKFVNDKFVKEMGIENITTTVSGIEEKSDFAMNENQENRIFRTDLMNELMEESMDVAQETEQQNKIKHLNNSECLDEKFNTNTNANTNAHNNDDEENKYKVKELKLVSKVSTMEEGAQKLPNQLVGQNVLKKNASMNNVINNDNVNISSTSSLDSDKAKSLSANR